MTETQMNLEDWLDDLCVRFIVNLPEDNLSSVERICFQVEEAQWFYEDFIRPLDPTLPSLNLRDFCIRIFTHCPLLAGFAAGGRHMQAFEEFLLYKKRIPVRGAIMLNETMDAAVLVKGWKKGANWSFPRGKINKDEDDLICAIREVYEETGYDLEAAGLVPTDREVKYIEVNMREQQMRLYVFKNVPMDTYFEPRTRKEISKIQWWQLSELPAFRRKNQQDSPEAGTNANKFYMVAPFLVPLRKWVTEQKKTGSQRVVSTQYLSAAMSYDENMTTEDDRGEESATQATHNVSAPASNSLEKATEALTRLLKLQPPTQGLQVDALGSTPAGKNSGQALLALLQSQPPISNPQLTSNAPPHTPLDHAISQNLVPITPHHQHPRPPKFSTLPPPPMFPIDNSNGTFSYQNPAAQNFRRAEQGTRHHQNAQYNQQPRTHHPHSEQSQHLVHPQPLPPQVQKAVFTGGPVHAPMVPQAIVQNQRHFNSTISVAISHPQFPGLHSPMVPPVPKQSPPKLNNHSLALLNVFKGTGNQEISKLPSSNNDVATHATVSSHIHGLRSQPQELPAELLRVPPQAPIAHLHNQNNSNPLSPRQPITATQKSTLLDMFKSPMIQPSVPVVGPTATALPSSTPSAVELSAVEPLSSTAASVYALLKEKRTPDANISTSHGPEVNREANLPFHAMSILSRPLETGNKKTTAGPSMEPHANRNGARQLPVSTSQSKPAKSIPKPFQPQILKRPRPELPTDTKSAPLPSILNPATFDRQTSSGPSQPKLEPKLERKSAQPAEQRQTLLSMFEKSSSASHSPSMVTPEGHSAIGIADPSGRSRVDSLTSANAASRRGSQTPISPADKGFLLSYLDAVASGHQK